MKSHIGVVQMNSSDNIEENLTFAQAKIQQAEAEGIDLIAFPETFLYISHDHDEKHRVAQTLEGQIVQTFQDYASKYDLSILLGSIYEKIPSDKERLYNTSILINRQGELNGVYRKIYMCDAPALGYNESEGIKPGDTPVVVDHEIGKIGLSICYDLRFPELYRDLTAKGAEIIFVPAAFFLYTGKHHWLPLLIARAIENQVYIVAPNQWGEHYEGRISYGSSVVIDPWGSVVCCAPERPDLVSTMIDLTYLRDVRANMPILNHGRPEVYQNN
ncbi:MAG: carbon-nitrogen hydrolase family protein [Gammaproteobacteria bacterium]|nr:MAG: carbon-nitrogen hydrolase family protein [Gammaproteobacteria bacterium]